MLATGSQDDAEEPALPASGFGLKQVKVVLFAFDGAFGTRAGITMAMEKVAVSRDEGMKAVILLGIGIDDPTIGRARTAIVKEGTRR